MRRYAGSRSVARLGLTGLLGLLFGCYWTEESRKKFEDRTRVVCWVVDKFITDGEADAERLREKNPEKATELLSQYSDKAAELRIKKVAATVAFQNCNGERLERILKSTLDLLDKAMEMLPQAEQVLKILGLIAEEYDIDLRGTATQALGEQGAGVQFEIVPSEGVILRGAQGTPLWRLWTSGSLTLSRESGGDKAITLKSLRLVFNPGFAGGRVFVIEDRGVDMELSTSRDDSVFAQGWRARFSGDLCLKFLSGAGDIAPARKRETATLDFYFNDNFSRCAISTLGPMPAGSLFPRSLRAPDTRIWAFYPQSPLVADEENFFVVENGVPFARCEIYTSTGWGDAGANLHGAPWQLDLGTQEPLAQMDLDAAGNGTAYFTPAANDVGRIRLFQGLVRGASGSRSTVACAAKVSRAFRRGDVNDDGLVNLADAVGGLQYLFRGGATPACELSADANASGSIDISDSIFALNWLFLGGPEPPLPGPLACGAADWSSGDGLSCDKFTSC